jgi:hypothetical protein
MPVALKRGSFYSRARYALRDNHKDEFLEIYAEKRKENPRSEGKTTAEKGDIDRSNYMKALTVLTKRYRKEYDELLSQIVPNRNKPREPRGTYAAENWNIRKYHSGKIIVMLGNAIVFQTTSMKYALAFVADKTEENTDEA